MGWGRIFLKYKYNVSAMLFTNTAGEINMPGEIIHTSLVLVPSGLGQGFFLRTGVMQVPCFLKEKFI